MAAKPLLAPDFLATTKKQVISYNNTQWKLLQYYSDGQLVCVKQRVVVLTIQLYRTFKAD